MKTLMKWALPPLALVLAGVAVWGLIALKPPVEKKDESRQVAALDVARAELRTVRVKVETQGEVRARTRIELTPEVSGRIAEVNPHFAEGGAFTPDTVLLKIDDAPFRLALIRAQAQVAQAKVALEQELADAAIKEKQWRDWMQDGEPTPLALNKPQVAQAQAQLRAAEADLAEAELNLARTEIRVPFAGRVAARTIGLGQYITLGQSLGQVFATDVVEVRLPLTDRQLGELALPVGFTAETPAQAVPVTLSAELGGAMRSWQGRIVRMQAAIDNQTRLFYAIAEVTAPYGTERASPLPVGLFVKATIDAVRPQPGMVIPRVALRGDNTVYVVENGRLQIVEVPVLSTSSEEAILAGGLPDGALVVTSPVRSAFDGMAVQITGTALAEDGKDERSDNQATAGDAAALAL